MNTLLKTILEIPTESGLCEAMQEFLTRYASAKNWHWRMDAAGNVYVTKGNARNFPCAVAHMDTVHRIEPGGITAIEINGRVTGINPQTMEQTGIGGDDKCGIYAALRCLSELPACKAAFFVDEEIGCRGSRAADMSFFGDCRFVLQADRRGNSDFVADIAGPLSSRDFLRAVRPILKSHGFKLCRGAMTDVQALRDNGIGISVANVSAGYYEPHRRNEYIALADLENTVQLMLAICRGLTRVFPFDYSPPPPPPKRAVSRYKFPDWPGEREYAWTLDGEREDVWTVEDDARLAVQRDLSDAIGRIMAGKE